MKSQGPRCRSLADRHSVSHLSSQKRSSQIQLDNGYKDPDDGGGDGVIIIMMAMMIMPEYTFFISEHYVNTQHVLGQSSHYASFCF